MNEHTFSGDDVFIRTESGDVTVVDSQSFERLRLIDKCICVMNAEGHFGWRRKGEFTSNCLHVVVHGGDIPAGSLVHHCDFDPANNRRNNLTVLSYGTHRRLHCRAARDSVFRKWIQAPENRHLVGCESAWPVESFATLPKYLRKRILAQAA